MVESVDDGDQAAVACHVDVDLDLHVGVVAVDGVVGWWREVSTSMSRLGFAVSVGDSGAMFGAR